MYAVLQMTCTSIKEQEYLLKVLPFDKVPKSNFSNDLSNFGVMTTDKAYVDLHLQEM